MSSGIISTYDVLTFSEMISHIITRLTRRTIQRCKNPKNGQFHRVGDDKNDDTFSYACLSLSQARSSERNRVTRSAPTYFRQTYGLLSKRDVRTVCSCQSSDFSAKSHQRGRARRSERTTRHSSAAPSISLSLRGRREALRLRSFTLIRTYVSYGETYVCCHRVRAYLTPCFIFLSWPRYHP